MVCTSNAGTPKRCNTPGPQPDPARQARGRIRGPERPGYRLTVSAISPGDRRTRPAAAGYPSDGTELG